TDPIRAAGNRKRAASANQCRLVRSIVFEIAQLRKAGFDRGVLNRTVLTNAADDSVRNATRAGKILDHAAAGVSAQECDVYSRRDRGLHILQHVQRPILIMADGNQALGAKKAFRVRVRIDVADIRQVVTGFLHPEGKRKFPEQELTGTLRQWGVENLAVFSI